jgi:GH15 family glucan-1,4-alpha-glucosidase
MDQAIPMARGLHARERTAEPRYRPIRDYAAIGDCHGSALVSRDGSMDWCALRRFDADPVFCRILDAERGGFWSIRPQGEYRARRSYLPDTNILRTVFSTAEGEVALTDFMPVGRRLDAGPHDYVSLNAPHWLVRRIEGVRGAVELVVRYRPSRAFARHPTELALEEGAIHGEGAPSLFTDLEFTLEGDSASAEVTLHAGSYRDLVLAASTVPGHPPTERVSEFFRITRAFWEEWIAYCRYEGPYRDAVRRSALALKLMTYAPSGALVAALTTSLPEEVGGERNWDYRFCWLRDACFTLYALAVLGYGGEARRFHDYLAQAVRQTLPRIQIMYGIEREHELTERTLEHLDGYAGSRPVRIGNGAHAQHQIDVYGQTLDLALLYRTLGGRLDEQYRRLLATFAEFVAAHWEEPDQGLWEMRGPPRHHVHGKLMSWVAMDRARQLFDDGRSWAALAAEIRDEILGRAVDRERRHLAQAFDGGIDAAVLLAPMLGFPAERETLEATIDSVEHGLARGDFLRRYEGPDGLVGDEGAFLICSFWLVDAKLAVGRADEAKALLARLVRCANDVGLYPEEIEPQSGAFLGNFPQAFTHLALIGSAVNLQLYQRRGVRAVLGSYADRARRAVEATFGWRGLWAAFKQSRRVARLRSSPASKLAWP